MADHLTKEQRSYNMSRIRSKWTGPEKKVHNYLKGNKVKHRMHPQITGNPDILLKKSNSVVFLQGCFWHKCPKCYQEPKTRKKFWIAKAEYNAKRDRKNIRRLKNAGFKVVKIWEHEIKKDFRKALKKILD